LFWFNGEKMEGIIVDLKKDKDWIYIINFNAKESSILLRQEEEKEMRGSSGKYLFFSDDKNELIDLAKEILKKFNLFVSKVSKECRKGFVLCIYDFKSRYKNDLNKYSNSSIRYRFWKSNKDTINNKYSKEYKNAS